MLYKGKGYLGSPANLIFKISSNLWLENAMSQGFLIMQLFLRRKKAGGFQQISQYEILSEINLASYPHKTGKKIASLCANPTKYIKKMRYRSQIPSANE